MRMTVSLLRGLVVGCLTVMSLSGCSSTLPLYSGPRLNPENAALLMVEPGIVLRSVDGNKVPSAGAYELRPGTHTLVVAYYSSFGGSSIWSTVNKTLKFTAQSGNHYLVLGGIQNGGWHPSRKRGQPMNFRIPSETGSVLAFKYLFFPNFGNALRLGEES